MDNGARRAMKNFFHGAVLKEETLQKTQGQYVTRQRPNNHTKRVEAE
jgi:hypothetical protein